MPCLYKVHFPLSHLSTPASAFWHQYAQIISKFACLDGYPVVTLLKFEIGTFYARAQQRNFINSISGNFETKCIKRYHIELRLEPVSPPITPPVSNACQLFSVLQLFKYVK